MFKKEDLYRHLQNTMKEERYRHILGVVNTSLSLCDKYGIDHEKAELAALFHDYAKSYSFEENCRFLELRGIDLDRVQERSPQLLHSKVGAVIAKEKYGIEDEDILNAIRYHTTGRSGMSDLEVLIALADYIEPGRSYEGVQKIRECEEESGMEAALLQALNNTISYLLKNGQLIHLDTIDARNDLMMRFSNLTERE